jgi:hypothetical protein
MCGGLRYHASISGAWSCKNMQQQYGMWVDAYQCATWCALQTAVGHKLSDTCVQVANLAKRAEAQKRSEKQRSKALAARTPAEPAPDKLLENCLRHLSALKQEFSSDVDEARIDLDGTPMEKFWASSALLTERRALLHRNLGIVFPGKLAPLCKRLEGLVSKERAPCLFTLCPAPLPFL